MAEMFYFAQADISIDRMTSDGPGDEDVNTQSGRQTRVKVKTSTPAPAESGQEIQVYVDYSVSEVRKDNTNLSGRVIATIQLESGLTFNRFGDGFKNADYNEGIGGEQHNWIDISTGRGIVGSVLQWCSIKIDGEGDDDGGNTQLRGHLSVPMWVNVVDANPANHGEVTPSSFKVLPLTLDAALASSNAAARALAANRRSQGVAKISTSRVPPLFAKAKKI